MGEPGETVSAKQAVSAGPGQQQEEGIEVTAMGICSVVMLLLLLLVHLVLGYLPHPHYSLKMASISLPQTKLKSVAITGASGLMGSHLARSLEAQGVRVIRISRQPQADDDSSIQWDVSTGKLSRVDLLEGLDAFIHLAGDNVASGEGPLAFLGQWSEDKKRSIMDSRVLSSRLVVKTLASLRNKPAVLVSASAVGYYGYTDFDVAFDESCPQRGSGFLAEVVENWEKEALRAQQEAGVRTVCLRLAPILSTEAGMLAKLLPLFSWGKKSLYVYFNES